MTRNISLWDLTTLSSDAYAKLLERTEADLSAYLDKVKPIIEAVRIGGDEAVCAFTERFDGAKVAPDAIRVSDQEFEEAERLVSPKVRDAIIAAAANIRKYHQTQMPKPIGMSTVSSGVLAGERWSAIPSVACYVPRGKGSFPSVCLMTAIPAVVAGVEKICILTPPGPDGTIDAATLFGAKHAGVAEVYKCGGSQGVAAVAYGTERVGKFDKIVGPGSPWVVAAKIILARQIDPGPPAGPSEAIVLADKSANPWKVTLDLINESEHGPDSSAFLVTDDRALADEVDRLIPLVWQRLGETRRGYSKTVLAGARGGTVLCRDMKEALQFCNDYAAEHLQVHSAEPFKYLEGLKHAGEILLGEHAAICLGNFVLGVNAILPTARAARTASPLSVYDYLKRTSIAYVTAEGYPAMADVAHTLAEYEGFEGHALAVSSLRDTKPS